MNIETSQRELKSQISSLRAKTSVQKARIDDLERELENVRARQKEDMRVTNESAHFHMLEGNKLRTQLQTHQQALKEAKVA